MTSNLSEYYKQQVEDNLLHFWEKAVDHQNGGMYTCFNNEGTVLVSKDKYTWSQGRFLWIWSKIASMVENGLLNNEADFYLSHLEKTVRFINKNVFLENGNCAFLLTNLGEKKESVLGKGFDTSFFADCFIALGMASYGKLLKDKGILDKGLALYDRIVQRLEDGSVQSEPYPVPEGFKSHSFSMIMLNVSQEIAEATGELQHQRHQELLNDSVFYMKDVMENFQLRDRRIVEMLPDQKEKKETLLYRHVNPGHTIESMWFVMTTAERTGHQKYIKEAVNIIEKALELGWDDKYGGLLRFVDYSGAEPKGEKTGGLYEKLILETWDTKLWWPHSEALYTTLLAYKMTKAPSMLEWYKKVEDYVFRTFPNKDREIGEWIQIRNRRGEPIDQVVALPVKDPFHILRNMLLIIELLEDDTFNPV